MSTAKEKAKSVKITEIIFTIVELSYAVWILYFFWDSSSNKTVYWIFSFIPRKPRPGLRTDEEREREDNEEKTFESTNHTRNKMLVVVGIAIGVGILLQVLAINRLNEAVEMSESSPHDASTKLAWHEGYQQVMLILYAVTIFLLPAALIRVACLTTVKPWMIQLKKEIEDQIVPAMNPVFGEGRDGVIRTYPQSDTDSSIYPGSSSDFSQIKTV